MRVTNPKQPFMCPTATRLAALKLGCHHGRIQRDCAGEAASRLGVIAPDAALPALGSQPVAESMLVQDG